MRTLLTRACRTLIALSVLLPGINWTQLLPSHYRFESSCVERISRSRRSSSQILLSVPFCSPDEKADVFSPRLKFLSTQECTLFLLWSLICAPGSLGGHWFQGMPHTLSSWALNGIPTFYRSSPDLAPLCGNYVFYSGIFG